MATGIFRRGVGRGFRASRKLAAGMLCLVVLLQGGGQTVTEGAPAGAATSGAAEIRAALEARWQRDPLPQRAFAGFVVVDPEDGQVIFRHNERMLFTPASNAKLYSTALALSRLGAEYRFETALRMEGEFLESQGLLRGNLALTGRGDPSMGGRLYPYAAETANERDDSLPAMEAFADAVVARGIRTIEGDVIGDDTAYLWEPFREGWAQDDALYEYGAPVSALSLNDNAVRVTVRPGTEPGSLAAVSVVPEGEYFDIVNEVETVKGATARLEWERVAGERLLLLRGELPPGSPARVLRVAVDDPARFAAHVLRQALLRRGIRVEGTVRVRHRLTPEYNPDKGAEAADGEPQGGEGQLLHLRLSPPLSELIAVVNKESQNLHAELLLYEVARVTQGVGSRSGAFTELRRFLAASAVPVEGVTLADASGLARLNLVSPEATALLLTAMWRSSHRDLWVNSLPVGGAEGTLRGRFSGNALGASIRAKTGTLRGVVALSGYVQTRGGKTLVFSGMVNNHGGPSAQARAFLDTLALEIAARP